jgi:NAD(P)-dependent dehydrogenase (short-subunit alcohol dehydrogenase family)
MQFNLEGKVALVTGAAGDIGRATIATLLAEGVKIVAEDIRSDVRELESEQLAPFCGNAADPATAEAAVRMALERFGRLDILVNNAGRTLNRPVADTTLEEWDEIQAVNTGSCFVHARAVLPYMLAQRQGAIVNVSSISACIGMPGLAAYSASKGAINQLTRVLAAEAGSAGVRVNAVAPGVVETAFLGGTPEQSRATLASFGHAHLLGRVAQPQEIADVIVWLASCRASFITGAVIMADGGYTTI